ncbi:hypothetical protein D046_2562A, partial [Vibrio parahaemolyticus V-223/04]
MTKLTIFYDGTCP